MNYDDEYEYGEELSEKEHSHLQLVKPGYQPPIARPYRIHLPFSLCCFALGVCGGYYLGVWDAYRGAKQVTEFFCGEEHHPTTNLNIWRMRP